MTVSNAGDAIRLDSFLKYWGKASKGDQAHIFHPAAYHCLDVAASGRALLETDPYLRMRLTRAMGIPSESLIDWVTALLAIHDVGKWSDGFQNLRPDLMQRLQGRTIDTSYVERHDLLGYRYWNELVLPELLTKGVLGFPSDDVRDWRELVAPWLRPIMGHHGKPPALPPFPTPLQAQFPDSVDRDALAFVDRVFKWLAPNAPPFGLEPFDSQVLQFKQGSWLLAGLAVVADWIGSNAEWFAPVAARLDLELYWDQIAWPRAQHAVKVAGLCPAAVRQTGGLRGLFPGFQEPTPLQDLVERLGLENGPQLFVVEEVTGGGKTEAALLLAHRMIEAGLADGVYIALPTMATANAMYDRVREVYRRLFAGEIAPSIVLAHAKQHLKLGLEATAVEKTLVSGELTGSQACAGWLSDSRKKALLAQVGVGTIDQALLGILPVRHQSLRILGLHRKVLVVDEVHANDAYVHRLLATVLEFHAALGGSAILMSATLSARQRHDLVAAFQRGLGAASPGTLPDETDAASVAYPLLTQTGAEGTVQVAFAARVSASRAVSINPLYTIDSVDDYLEATLRSDGCACWIRNTVADAFEAYERWVQRLGSGRVTLFHSRFAAGDRFDLEQRIIDAFGKHSGPEERRGRLLIATQVVEQSLDLDFDAMVTDLAPIDLMIQRAGRVHRHARDTAGCRLQAGDDARGLTGLGVFMPPVVDDPPENWYKAQLGRAAYVYRNQGELWRTACWMIRNGRFRMPEDARDMIEFVYGPTTDVDLPASLRRSTLEADVETKSHNALAAQNALKLRQGYAATPDQWREDDVTPTRLGDPQSTLRLVRVVDGRWQAWRAGDDYPWDRSEVQVRQQLVAFEDPDLPTEVVESMRASMRDRGRHVVIVPLEQRGDSWMGRAMDNRHRRVNVRYSADLGLSLQYEEDAE